MQNLPGVARSPFGIGLLSVWGSSPQDTRVYVDGVNIPTLYHFGGLRSTVNSEMVESLTFVPGGYQADHGLGLGGVIDVATRRPRTDGFHGYAQMDLVDGSLMLEGPLTKTLSFAVAARRSWIDATLPLLHQQHAPAVARLLGLPGAPVLAADARATTSTCSSSGRTTSSTCVANAGGERAPRRRRRTSIFTAASSAGCAGCRAAARCR